MGAVPPIPDGTQDFANVVITLDGTTLLGGKTYKVSNDSPATTDDVGGNGDVVVVVSNDLRGSIEVEFMPSSPSLDFMSQQVLAFRATRRFVAVSVKDLNGRSVASGASAWVEKIADSDYGPEVASRTFRIRVARLANFVGGTV